VALFVLVVIGLVVAQTWLDWRDTNRNWVVPEWVKGLALAAVAVISLTSATSFASSWLQGEAGDWSTELSSRRLWFELGFLICSMGLIVLGARKKRLRLALVMAGIAAAIICWVGMTA
jgi:peptidoglycan/LPS O-acetylase OafA/YrhL